MDILSLSAVELGRAVREGHATAVEAMQAVFGRIEEKEELCHCYITVDKAEALKRAEEAQRKIEAGELSGPLCGVPMALKDNLCTKGIRTTCGSRMLGNYVPHYSAEAVLALEQAGAVLVGKTNMDEFAMGSTTETSAYGATRNPHNPEHVPGGSSGGSAAAVAAGECFFALGSDTGGSIRQPASHCGVVGLKPTYGTVSRFGLVAYASSMDQIGPICRNVEDCAVVLESISSSALGNPEVGQKLQVRQELQERQTCQEPQRKQNGKQRCWETRDSTFLGRKDTNFSEALKKDVTGMRIGVPRDSVSQTMCGEGLDAEVRGAILEAAELLKANGAIVEEFDLSLQEYAIPAYYTIASAEASSNLQRFDGVRYGYRKEGVKELHEMYQRSRSHSFGVEVKRRIMLGSFVLSSGYYDAYYLKALQVKTMIKEAFHEAFVKYDCIMGPTAPATAPKLGESLADPLKMYLGDIYTVSANLAGLPAISVPCGADSRGLPIGLQLIGDCFQEKKLLRAAYTYEKLREEAEACGENMRLL